MNRGILRGIGADAFVPRYAGGGDATQDGGVLVADSTAEGLIRLSPSPSYVPGGTWAYTGALDQINTNATPTLNRLYATPFDVGSAKVTFSAIGVVVATGLATAVIRLGIYVDTAGQPGALVGDYGTIDASTNNYKTITIPGGVALAGRVWLAAVGQVAVTSTGCCVASVNDPRIGQNSPFSVGGGTGYYHSSAQAGALPNPWGASSTLTLGQSAVIRIYLTAA